MLIHNRQRVTSVDIDRQTGEINIKGALSLNCCKRRVIIETRIGS